MREEIRRIHGETKITTIYVTHDQKEALSLAEQMAVMDCGRVVQIGRPREVYRHPINRFVADFIGETNWLTGQIQGQTADLFEIGTELGVWRAKANAATGLAQKVRIGFRPEAVRFGRADANEFVC